MASKRPLERFGTDIKNVQWRSYGVAILSVAVALGIMLLLRARLYATITPLFLIAVIISTWYGGWKAGVLATVLSTLAINYYLLEPFYFLSFPSLETVVQVSTFLMAAGLISSLNHSRCKALQNARESLQTLQAAMGREQAILAEANTANERMEKVLNSINDGFYVLNHDWQFTYVNDRYCEMVQMQPSELLGQNIWGLFPVAVDTEAYVQFHQAMAEQTPRQFDYLYTPWNCWHDHRIYPSPTGLTVLIADITARKQAEAALRESESRFRTLADNIAQFAWMADETGWIFWYNQRWFDYTGTTPEEVEGWGWQKAHHPDYVDQVVAKFRHHIATGEIWEDTFPLCSQDGQFRWFLSRAMPIRNEQGEVVRWFGTNTDITDRKQAEAEREQLLQREQVLRQQAEAAEAKLQQVLTSIREDFVLFDRNWHIAYLNAQAAETIGLPRGETLGKNLWNLFPDLVGTEFYDRLHQVMLDRTPIQFEYYYPTWERWFENRLYPTPDGIVNLCSDITARKRAELNDQFLNQLEARLRQLSNANPDEMLWETMSRLGEYLNVDRAVWHAIDADNGLSFVEQDWRRDDIPSAIGVHRLRDFILPDLLDLYQLGQTAVASDVTTYPYTASFADNFASFGTRAFIATPCIHEGRWVALLAVDAKSMRHWRSDEVALLQEIVARLWLLIEHTRAVQELHQSEAEFRQLANAMPQIVYVSSADGVLEFVNDRWTDYTGLTLEQSRNQALMQQVIPPEDYEQIRSDFVRAQEAQSPYQSQFRLVQPDGSYLYFLTRAIPLLNEQGQVRKWYGTSTDITGLKQLEAELRQKNAILDVINESAPTPIFVKDRQGRIIYANPATLKVLNKTAEEVIGYRDCDLYPNLEDATRVMENDRRIMESGQMEVVEESPDGIRTFLGMKVPYRNEAGAVIGLIGISNDISDRVQLERDRERILQQEQVAREAAEHANRIKDEFLAVLSHELRSPLNPILGWSKLLQQGKLDAARTKTALATIERNAQLQVQLIDDLLDISRILRGKLSLNVLPVDLKIVIASALETVRLAAESKSQHVETILSPLCGTVMGDAGRLQQVIWNLLSNAVKFTPYAGQITIALAQSETHAQIQVTDTGKGIKPDFLPYVFEHFRQEDGATTRKFGGLGLGLAIARQIVEMHGGQISVDSPGEGQGTTFTVQLPLAPLSSQLLSSKPSSASTPNLNSIHILVVDDELDSREIVAFVLEQAGAIVTSVASGIEALQAIEQAVPDLIVSDIGMPEMDGYMLLQQARMLEQVRHVPAIALTAYAGEFDRQQALQAGFQQHIAKPIEPQVLIQAIAELRESHNG